MNISTPKPVGRLNGPLRRLSGFLFGGACLFWVLRDLTWDSLTGQWALVEWPWILLAMCCETVSYVFEAARWRLLFPQPEFGSKRALQATYIGLLVNQVLPMRMGDLARAWIAGRWTGVAVLDVVPPLLVARLLDGFCVAIAIGIAALISPLPPSMLAGARAFGTVVALLSVLFVLLMRRPREEIVGWTNAGTNRLARIRSFVGRMAAGLHAAGNEPKFWQAAVASVAFLLCQTAAFLLALHGCGVPLSIGAGVTVFLLVHLGTALPGAPGNIGSFQVMVTVGLRLFGVDKATAAAFSVIAFVILTLPLFCAGTVALASSDVGPSTLWQILSGRNNKAKGGHIAGTAHNPNERSRR